MTDYQVFSTKYSLTLSAAALNYIEQVFTEVWSFCISIIADNGLTFQGEIPQHEWMNGIELWAKEYLKIEGASSSANHP